MSDTVKWTAAQREAIDDRNHDLLVSAAAGSGKTAVMIERVLTLLKNGESSIDKMLIVTYTEAAASSMKAKLVKELKKEYKRTHDIRLKQQLQLSERANISTIHAFCIQLLRRYYYLTTLSPDFRIIDDAQKNTIFEQAMNETLEEACKQYNDGSFPALKQAFVQFSGRKNDTPLVNTINILYAFMQSLPDKEAFRQKALSLYKKDDPCYETYFLNYLDHLADCFTEYLNDMKRRYADTAIASSVTDYADSFIDRYALVRQSTSAEEKVACFFARAKSCTIKDPIFAGEKDALRAMRKDVNTRIKADKDTLETDDFVAGLNVLFCLTERYAEKIKEKMDEEGGLTFDGLLRESVDLLREHPEIKEEIDFDYIFIDEYQDVNALLDFLATALAKPGRLFMVGDIKQSIYGFQNAHPQFFMDKMERYQSEQTGRRINLCNNFRSNKEILDGVNFIFGQIMHKDTFEVEYDAEASLYPGPDKEGIQYRSCFYCEGEPEAANEILISDPELTDEAEAIARRISEMKNCTVYDEELKAMRPVCYGDIAVLSRKNCFAPLLQEACRHYGIPVSTPDFQPLADEDACGVLVALLRLLLFRRRDTDLITVMASCIGGFTMTELSAIRLQRPGTSFYDAVFSFEGDKALQEKLQRFEFLLDELQLMQRSMALADFLEYTVESTGYLYYAAASPDGNKQRVSIEKLIAAARNYSANIAGTLNGFLTYYKNLKDRSDKSGTLQIGKDDNAVHCLTMHKSKGLEFPIVIVASLGDPLVGSHKGIMLNEDLGVAKKIISENEFGNRIEATSMAYRVHSIARSKSESAESLRLLYVAMTRAKYKLILSLPLSCEDMCKADRPPSGLTFTCAKSFAELLVPLLARHPDGLGLREYMYHDFCPYEPDETDVSRWRVCTVQGTAPEPAAVEAKEELAEADQNDRAYTAELERGLSWQYAYEASVNARTKTNPSKASDRIRPQLHRPSFEDKDFEGAQKGTVVHFFMEHVDFSSSLCAKEQAERMQEAGLFTDEEFAALPFDQLDDFLQGEFCGRIRRSELVLRERSFCQIVPYNDEGDEALIQGIIDCYFFEGDTIILLDYKTDLIHDDLDAHIRHHSVQLRLYRDALEQLYPGKTVKPYLHFFSIKQTVPVPET